MKNKDIEKIIEDFNKNNIWAKGVSQVSDYIKTQLIEMHETSYLKGYNRGLKEK